MAAYNVVRFRVKPGRQQEFEKIHAQLAEKLPGARKAALIKTGERDYCFLAEWNSMDDIVAARPRMVGNLDRFRDLLEDLGGGLGVTDPVSGEAVVELWG